MIKLSKRIKQLKLSAHRKVFSQFIGNYRSLFKGQGIEFADLREYIPGDNVKDIDWNTFAKTAKLFVRKYEEDRELTIVFAVDTSSSMGAPTSQAGSKLDLLLNTIFCLCFAAEANNDRMGLYLFNAKRTSALPFGKGHKQTLRILNAVAQQFVENYFQAGNLNALCNYLLYQVKKRVVCFLFTDSLDLSDLALQKLLRAVKKRHELIVFNLNDLPQLESLTGNIQLQDIETGEMVKLDFRDSKLKQQYQKLVEEEEQKSGQLLRQFGINHLSLNPTDEILNKLAIFFRKLNLNHDRHP